MKPKKLARIALARKKIYKSFSSCFKAFEPNSDYIYGRHTREIIKECQSATNAIERGENYYAVISVGPRHGKSDIVSRTYPSWHLLRNPTHSIILATYGQALASDLSYDARNTSARLFRLYENVSLSKDRASVASWKTEQGGSMNASGIEGAITGRGAHILIIDDYFKGHSEAESKATRDSVWRNFTSELMSRISPEGHAVIILATRWHQDDLVGRIKDKMKEDPDFPQFKIINFPAYDEEKDEYLFPERFSEQFYKNQKSLGDYRWSALYQGRPVALGGNVFQVDNIKYIDKAPDDMAFIRVWDIASTPKGDYTVGSLVGIDDDDNVIVGDMVRFREKAVKREELMTNTAIEDGPEVRQLIEGVGGYKDAVDRLDEILKGKSIVEKDTPTKSKEIRALSLEPLIEGGKLHFVKADWNAAAKLELAEYPKSKHDDIIDTLSAGYKYLRADGDWLFM